MKLAHLLESLQSVEDRHEHVEQEKFGRGCLLQALQKSRGLAILFITHDLTIVRRMAETVHVMTDGRIVESGPTETIFTNPRGERTKDYTNARYA